MVRSSCKRLARALLVLALLPGGAASPFAARAQSATGSIEGLVVDSSGAILKDVSITLRHAATGADRALVTDASGWFRAPLLPVGAYELTAALAGFETWRQGDIRVNVGQVLNLPIEMAVSGVAETVDVASATLILETSRSHASSVVDEIAIQNLPVNGRNFIDFVLLTPGVTRDTRLGDLSFAGQRGWLNSLVVDGADNNNTYFGQSLGRVGLGRAPYQFSQDAVKEFQVNSNAYSAEYGRAGGGVINVVTKSGTNDLHGSAFEFYRDKALNATNAINTQDGQPKSPYHYHQFGGTLGGPLRADRDFFFFTYDGQRNTQPNAVFMSLPSNTPGDAATLAAIERLRPLAFSWERRLDQDVFLARTDHDAGSGHVWVRYNQQDFRGEGFEAGGPQNTFEHTGTSRVHTRTLNASWIAVPGDRLFNELRVQYARDHEPGDANTEKPEAFVTQSGALVLIIGRNNFSPRENTIDRAQVADAITWVGGAHTVKSGFDVQLDRVRNVFPGYFSGSYPFRSLASFARGRPDGPNEFYVQSFPGPGTTGAETSPSVAEYSAFVQDEWRPRADVTLNLGWRYDLMTTDAPGVRNPDPQLAAAGIDTSWQESDINNHGPRLGIAWSPRGRGFVVRGGGGVFYGRTPALRLGGVAANNGVNVVSLTFTGDAVPTYPQRFTEIPAGSLAGRPNVFYVDDEFANSRIVQANAAVEWQLFRDTSLTATYLVVDGSSLPRSVDRNIGTRGSRTFTVAGSGTTVSYPIFGPDRPFSSVARLVALESSAVSRYHGMTVELNRRWSGDLQLRTAYTLGKVVDTVPETAVDDPFFASDPSDFDVDRTVGNNDQRHRLVASGVYSSGGRAAASAGWARALAEGWWLSAILTAESGRPYSARVLGVDLNGDGNSRNDLAPGTRRNDFRLAPLVTVDARIARDLPRVGPARLQLSWEVFNLFNRDNITAVVPAYYRVSGTTLSPNATFGRAQASAGERIMQLAARITF